MALEFRKRRFRRPDKNGQLAIAIGAVLIGLAIAIAWVAIAFRAQPHDGDDAPDSSADDAATYESASPTNLLVILTDEGHERFTLVQIDPAAQQIRTAAIPAELAVGDDSTLAKTMHKNGIADTVRHTADTLELPIEHYIALDGEQAESWFNYLESGIVITLPQRVDFTDDAGAIVRLDEGEHNLTATQTVALIRYDGWSDATVRQQFTAQVMTAMINQYATATRRFSSDFATLSNLGKTSLRIGDFNNFLPALKHTVSTDETVCTTEVLQGSYQSNRFIFDKKATAADSSLYTD